MAKVAHGKAAGKKIEIWFGDEARVGQKNKITRRWALRGTRPIAPHDQRTQSTYIFGAICPAEGKATENTWQFMRDNWLSNRVFTSGEDIVDHCCDAWNKLVAQPWRIMSIGLRDWAHGF